MAKMASEVGVWKFEYNKDANNSTQTHYVKSKMSQISVWIKMVIRMVKQWTTYFEYTWY